MTELGQQIVIIRRYGGPGSGHHGHAGRPGMVGGSGAGGGGIKAKVEIADITDEYNISKGSLKDNSTAIYVGDIEVLVGIGTRYYPKKGGQPVDFNGKVVLGPKEWLGKDAQDILELKKVIDREFDKVVGQIDGGDFAKAEYAKDNQHIEKLLYMYKSPLTTGGEVSSILTTLSSAYLSKTKVTGKPLQSEALARIKNKKVTDDYIKTDREDWLKHTDSYINADKYIFNAKISDIHFLKSKRMLFSQESVDQFASEVKRTQNFLEKQYPTGKVMVFRGVSGDYANSIKEAFKRESNIQIQTRTITSWSSNRGVASEFAGNKGVVIKKEIDVKDVLFSHHTSPYIRTSDFLFGGSEEYEFIVGSRTGEINISKEDLL